MSDVAITVENLGKQYQIGAKLQATYRTLRETLVEAFAAPVQRVGKLLRGRPIGVAGLDETIWALKDVSFEIKQGEVVGIIGRNGAGKSTLLKILSRITEPTVGYAKIHGRVGSLLEVGTGFSLELTGRENTYLNGAILGMKKHEIDRKFDEIVAFAELDKFIDTPVKHYSSGMYLRLAFAVAAHLEPEILLVDEVLAVGDATFQKKCLGKMEEVARGGRTVLFVSHNMVALQALCLRGILFEGGRVAADTSGPEAVRAYLTHYSNVVAQPLGDRKDRRGDGRLRFTECWLENSAGIRVSRAVIGENMRFCMAYRAREPLRNVQVGLTFQEPLGTPLVYCYTADVGQGFNVMPEEGVIVCEITKFPLRSSRYLGDIFARVQNQASDWVKGAFLFDVEDADFYGTGKLDVFHSTGRVLVSHAWDVRQEATRFFIASS